MSGAAGRSTRWAIVGLGFVASADFMLRMIRLRPEILSLLLTLIAIPLASSRRTVWLGIVAGVYTLSYTAFQAFLGLCALFFLYDVWVERRAQWRMILSPAMGVALGLLPHPHFPDNVHRWLVHDVR